MSTVIFTQSDLQRFERLMSQFKIQIGVKMKQYGKWVSGKTYDSITPYCNYYNNTLDIGLKSTNPTVVAVQETGRGPGKVPYDFECVIFKWSMQKGIQFKNQKARWEFANAVKWATIKEGSSQFKEGRNNDIFTNQYKTYERQVATIMDKCFKDQFYRMKLDFL